MLQKGHHIRVILNRNRYRRTLLVSYFFNFFYMTIKKPETDTISTTFLGAAIAAEALRGQAEQDRRDIETLTLQGRVIEEEQDCTFCKLRTICSDTDGKKRMSQVCEADFW